MLLYVASLTAVVIIFQSMIRPTNRPIAVSSEAFLIEACYLDEARGSI